MAMTEADGGYTPTSEERSSRESAAAAGAAQPPGRVEATPNAWRGRLVCVTGAGGTGSSLLAMCLATELAADASNRGLVLLADCSADAGQALMHDLGPASGRRRPVEAGDGRHGGGGPLRSMTVRPAGKGYDLLMDPHRRRPEVRDGSAEAAVDSLLAAYRYVVVDADTTDEELRGPEPTDAASGTALARAALRRSDLIVIVGTGDAAGLGRMVRTIDTMAGMFSSDRILPVINRLPRNPRSRSAAAAAIIRQMEGTAVLEAGDPVLIAERGSMSGAAHGRMAPASSLGRPLAAEVRVRLNAGGPRTGDEPARPRSGPTPSH